MREELMEYFNYSAEEVEARLRSAQQDLVKLWNRYNPKTPDEIAKWYQSRDVQEAYVFDLAAFWQLEQKKKDLEAFYRILNKNLRNNQSVLDYGAGNGEVLLYLAERLPMRFVYADYRGATREFAMWRALKRGLTNIYFTDLRPLDRQYHAIFCLDVLEHCDDLPGTAKMLCDHLVPGGLFFVQVAFAFDPNFHPMHLTKNAKYQHTFNSELMPGFGMEQVSGWLWRKKIDA